MNVAEAKEVKKQEEKLIALRDSRRAQICLLCNSRMGRDLLWWLCEQGSPFNSSLRWDANERGDPMRTAYAEGWRGLGSLILGEIMEAAPQGYVLMLSENRNVKELENINGRPSND